MKPTDELVHEHEVIELALDGLHSAAEDALRTGKLDVPLFEKAMDFLGNFADRCHHGKEEKHLFRLMEMRGMPREGGPLGVMLYDHEIGRRRRRDIVNALPKAAEGDREAIRIAAENAAEYCDELRQHIWKENHVLYPMADNVLTEQDWRELEEAFERVEKEEMGEGTHEKYHSIAHELGEHARPAEHVKRGH